MFIVRSAFWLSAAFIVMAPTAGMDVGESARQTGGQLVSQGAQAVSETLMPASCETIECMVGRTVLTQMSAEPAAQMAQTPMDVVAEATSQAFPPPRPAWAY